MMLVRKSTERHYQKEHGQDSWFSFGPSGEPALGKFGSLVVFRERKFVPRAAARDLGEEGEVITYVRAGSLAFEDARGRTGVLRRGEFQLMSAGLGVGSREMNVSPVQEAHVFQIWLRPEQFNSAPKERGRWLGHEQRRFSTAERKGRLCVVASLGGAERSLNLHQDVLIYSALFEPGQVVVYSLGRGRGAWLHVISGSVKSSGVILRAGDGAGFSEEAAVQFLVLEPTEVLLLDLGDFLPQPHFDQDVRQKHDEPRRVGIGSSEIANGQR